MADERIEQLWLYVASRAVQGLCSAGKAAAGQEYVPIVAAKIADGLVREYMKRFHAVEFDAMKKEGKTKWARSTTHSDP